MQSDTAAKINGARTAPTEQMPPLGDNIYFASVFREVTEYLNHYLQILSNEGRIGFEFYQEAVPLLQLLTSHSMEVAAELELSNQVLDSTDKRAVAKATSDVAIFIRRNAGMTIASTIEDYTLARLLRTLADFLRFEADMDARNNGTPTEIGAREGIEPQNEFWEYVWLDNRRCIRVNHPLLKHDIPDDFDELIVRRLKDALRLMNAHMSRRALQETNGMNEYRIRQQSIAAGESWLAELRAMVDNAREALGPTIFGDAGDDAEPSAISEGKLPMRSMDSQQPSSQNMMPLSSPRTGASLRPMMIPSRNISMSRSTFRNGHTVDQLANQMEALQKQVANLRAAGEGATSKTIDALDEAIFKSQLNHIEHSGPSTVPAIESAVLDAVAGPADPFMVMPSDVLMDPKL